MAVQIQLRNGTAAQWTSANPTLAVGEIGVETDTNRFKVGTGSTAWNSLAYSVGFSWKGTWSSVTAYVVNDVVYYNGSSYISIQNGTNQNPATQTAYWNTVALAGSVSSVAQSFTGGIVSVAGSPITSSGTLALTVAGTSGGVPYFSSGTTWATSSALASNALVVGGGAGSPPATVTTGTGVVTALGVNTGSAGAFVVNGGALGTPTSGTLTNATGLPISTGVAGLGTNVATFLATPTSANLISVVGDETGSGVLVFNSAPALTNPTVTNYVETLFSANTSTAITVSLANGTVQNLTLTGNATITMPTAVAGKSFIIILSQDATGSRTVTWSTVSWPSATAPTITTTASKKDIYSFFSDGTSWYGTTIGQNYT
jgi:hypothetical protein